MGVSMTTAITTLASNGYLLLGLLFSGWSVWTAIAAVWLELVIKAPFVAHRLQRAFPTLTEAELERYMAARDPEYRNGVSSGLRIRKALADSGLDGAASEAAREFLKFWGGLTFVMGLFVFVVGGISTGAARGDQVTGFDLSVFDFGSLALLAIIVVIGEGVALTIDRRGSALMPDIGGYVRRSTVIFLIAILGGFVVGSMDSAGPVVAAFFVLLKAAAELRTGRLPDDPPRSPEPTRAG